MLNTIAAIAALVIAPAQEESVRLERVYKAGDMESYAITAKLTEQGMDADVKGRLVLKILKDTKDGKTEAEYSTPSLTMTASGADTGASAPEPLKATLNKNGMPQDLEVKDEKWVYVLASLSAYLPASEVKVGGDYKVDWTSESKSVTITGKGTLQKVTSDAGAKIAVIKSMFTVSPKDDKEGNVELTSKVDATTGRLLETEGKVRVGDETVFTFTIKREAAAKG